MNFNASRNLGSSGGIRKAKRVSDVAAMGAPTPPPAYNVGPTYDPNFTPNINSQHQDPAQFQSNEFNVPVQHGNPPYNYPTPTGGDYMAQPPMASPSFPQAAAQFGNLFPQPIVQDMALQYGEQLAKSGKEALNREFDKYVPVTKLKYYFAVDTRYVIKKLFLIFFPFTHKDWTVKYDQDNPVQPRYELNAPDLYIPTMAYITYVLLVGFMLGLQHKFSPEQIGIQSSSALAYIIFEILLYLIIMYITNITTNLKMLDLLAFSGYKYAIMIACLLGGLLLQKTGYYIAFLYCSFALTFFLIRTLKVQVLAGSNATETNYNSYNQNPYVQQYKNSSGSKRRVYILLFVGLMQPILSWWLTYQLVPLGELKDTVQDVPVA